jgi:pimeloyl-ACP methyl ester carboxylesterase
VICRQRVLFLGGNGHSAARLAPARRALAERGAPFDILDVEYPGFEGRPRATNLEAFLDLVSDRIASAAGDTRPLLYGTGIGGLLALCLRARGSHADSHLLLQAPVLWGLERRLMPRLLRLVPAGPLLRFLFQSASFQRRFAGKHFSPPPPTAVLEGFFEGYARCAALPDLFAWMDPALLRKLESGLGGRPGALSGVSVWWGGRDRVVTLEELRLTGRALGVAWPVRMFPDWGHYPMIDVPEDWIGALVDELQVRAGR